MRRVRKGLCRTKKGRFARCRSASRRSKGKHCKFGVSKTTGRCLKNKRPRSKGRSCKFGVSKTTGRCLKRRRARR